jgi:diadenosine tetraphosphate (Ap4A) HIT family hydrolase
MLPNEDCTFCRQLAGGAGDAADRLADLPHSIVLFGHWQYYRGYCIVVARRHVRELFELSAEERHAFMDEVAGVADTLAEVLKPRKLNVEMLGNQVPHLHCHVFPRYDTDPEHLKPVWVALERGEKDPEERRRLEAAPDRERNRSLLRAELARLKP